jgi:hypothetical protein
MGISLPNLWRLRRDPGTWGRFPELSTIHALAHALEVPVQVPFIATGVSCQIIRDGTIVNGVPSARTRRTGRGPELTMVIPLGTRTSAEIDIVQEEVAGAISRTMQRLNLAHGQGIALEVPTLTPV